MKYFHFKYEQLKYQEPSFNEPVECEESEFVEVNKSYTDDSNNATFNSSTNRTSSIEFSNIDPPLNLEKLQEDHIFQVSQLKSQFLNEHATQHGNLKTINANIVQEQAH